MTHRKGAGPAPDPARDPLLGNPSYVSNVFNSGTLNTYHSREGAKIPVFFNPDKHYGRSSSFFISPVFAGPAIVQALTSLRLLMINSQ